MNELSESVYCSDNLVCNQINKAMKEGKVGKGRMLCQKSGPSLMVGVSDDFVTRTDSDCLWHDSRVIKVWC